MRISAALFVLLCSVPARADWAAYEPGNRMFRADIPVETWTPFEEEDALGAVVWFFGPEDPSGAARATLSVRLIDRDTPNFLPAKEAVEAMRRSTPGREASTVRPLRLTAGLARVFEVVDTRRLPVDYVPSALVDLHEYVAVIPRGNDYYLIRLVTARASYLDYKDDFVRFLRSFRPVGMR